MNIDELNNKYGVDKVGRVYDRFYDNGEVWMAEMLMSYMSQDDIEFYMDLEEEENNNNGEEMISTVKWFNAEIEKLNEGNEK
jgi:hypothetical protein